MKVLPENLMNSVLGKLYDVLCSGDDAVPKSKDNYLAWLPVGMPYPQETLKFLSEGFATINKQPQGNNTNEDSETQNVEESPEISVTDQLKLKMNYAEDLARICDQIPDTSGLAEGISMISFNQENTLSQAYEMILKFSQVYDVQPDEETKKEIERLRGLLTKKVKKTNLVTQEETETIEPSELVKLYSQKMFDYESAVSDYNNARISALTGSSPEAVLSWSMNAGTLRNRVKKADNDWIANGYKQEYDQIAAYINQVSSRSIALLKKEYLDDLEKSRYTGATTGSDFYYTSLLPSSFAHSNEGWTDFTFSSGDFESSSKTNSTKTSAAAVGALFGITFGGGGSVEKKKYNRKIDTSQFSLTFKICCVPIERSWYNTNFLYSNYWRFDQTNVSFKDATVSNGKMPPEGMIPAYTTAAVFIKDLKLSFGEKSYETTTEFEKKAGKGGFAWGPINFGMKHDKSSGERDSESSYSNQGIKVEGMQLIGFKCHMLPKSPNPNPDIKDWI